MGDSVPIIELKGITHKYSGMVALSDISLAIQNGEIHGLVGENGAGKSTLVKVMSGLIQPSGGGIELDGAPVRITPEMQSKLGISILPQHIEVFPFLSVAENLYAGKYPARGGLIDYRRLNEEARSWFDRFDLDIDPEAPMESLGFVQQKLVLIVKALKDNARLIILDEPTASLHHEEIEQLFRFVLEFNRKGASFVYISHHLEEIFKICHRVTVLKDGRLQGTFDVKTLDLRKLVHAMVGRDIGSLEKPAVRAFGPAVLAVRDLSSGGMLKGVSFEVRSGEVLGVLSNKGGGKDDLVRGLFGLGGGNAGELRLGDAPFSARSPRDAFRRGLCLLPEDRHREGLFLEKPLSENISACGLPGVCGRLGFLRRGSETNLAENYIRELSIATSSVRKLVQHLSGGNQQKVVFSKILHSGPKVLVLDSPTVGVDVKSRLEIHQAVRRVAGTGVAVLLLTSDLEEILTLSDRIVVLVKGRIVREILPDQSAFNRRDLGVIMEGGEA